MIRVLCFPLIFFLLSGCQTNQANKPKKAHLHLKLGTAHLSKGNYPAALKELKIAARLDKKNPVTFNNLGLAYLVRGKYELAEQNIRQAIALEPAYTEARNNLGRVLIHQNKFEDAEKVLKIAVNDLTFPAPEKSHSNLGIAYFKNKKYKLAEDHLKKSLRIRRDHCVTENYYGRTLYEQGLLKKALNTLDASIAKCDAQKFYEPRYFSALAAFKLGFREQSIAKFEEVVQIAPSSKFAKRSQEMLELIRKGQ